MEQFCKKYLKPISASATFGITLVTIFFIWFKDAKGIKDIFESGTYVKSLITYIVWMIGNFVVYKIYVPVTYYYDYARASKPHSQTESSDSKEK